MIERPQYDIELDGRRFERLMSSGATHEKIQEQIIFTEQQLKTDVGERLDRAESHYVYEIRDRKLYGEGVDEPFEDSIERGIIQTWDKSRENSELAGFRFIQSFMVDSKTPDGAMVFNPSPPDGLNYKKNYLDVYRKVGSQVHVVRYFSDLTNRQYRERILQINPAYEQAIPPEPKDTDFFLNPVVVPSHLRLNPDQLAEFVLGGKKGMDEAEFEQIWTDPNIVSLRLSIINTLVENPWAVLTLQQKQKGLYAGVRKVKDGEYKPTFDLAEMEIIYLAGQKDTLGEGGCGSSACSTSPDGRGPVNFSCPKCGGNNERPLFGYVKNCQSCGSKDVLPDSVRKMLN